MINRSLYGITAGIIGFGGMWVAVATLMRAFGMHIMAINLRALKVPSPFNLWMNTPYRADGALDWLPTVSKAGDYLVFRAELDCVVVMSACPQDLVPVNGIDCIPRDLEFEVL